jgi:hypothetical protein
MRKPRSLTPFNALQAAVYLAAVIAVIADVFIWRP